MAVASVILGEDRLAAGGPENSGAGGSGRLGLPLYFEDGVPGLGLPLISADSYGISEGGGRESSDEVRDMVDREGEVRFGIYGR